KRVPIENAVPGVAYAGLEGDFVVDHSRWGITETYVSSLRGNRREYEAGYDQGAGAGKLTIDKVPPSLVPFPDNPGGQYTTQATAEYRVLEGSVVASVIVGPKQRDVPTANPGPTEAWRERPSLASLELHNVGDVQITNQISPLDPGFGP